MSTLFYLILRVQLGEKWSDARRVSAGLANRCQTRATPQMTTSRLARREPSKRAKAALQPLAIGDCYRRAVPCLDTFGGR